MSCWSSLRMGNKAIYSVTIKWGVHRTQVQLCYNRFKDGREYVNDDVRSGRPSTSKTDKNIEENDFG